MKLTTWLTVVVATMLLVSACAGPQKFTTPCRQLSKQEIMVELQRATTSAEMRTVVDTARGVVHAWTDTSLVGATPKAYFSVYEWVFTVTDGQVVGRAIMQVLEKNALGNYQVSARRWYVDNTHGDHQWYWLVRNDIDQLCGTDLQWSEDRLSDVPK